MTLATRVSKLRENLTRWRAEISSAKTGATHLGGIAGKAVSHFEIVLRESLRWCLHSCHMSYDCKLAVQFEGKPFDKLTLGQVVKAFEYVDRELTIGLRLISPTAGRLLKYRSLIGASDKGRLKDINNLRIALVHHIEVFAKDEPTLLVNSRRLIEDIHHELEEPLFRIVQEGSPLDAT